MIAKMSLRARLIAPLLLMAGLLALVWWLQIRSQDLCADPRTQLARSKLAALLASASGSASRLESLEQVARAVGIEVMPPGPLAGPVVDRPVAATAWVEALSAWLHQEHPDRVVYLDLQPAPEASALHDRPFPVTGFLRIQMLLPQGNWWRGRLPMVFGLPAPEPSMAWMSVSLGSLALVLSICWVFRILRPLSSLARSAEGSHSDPHAVPLEENGAPELRQIARAINRSQSHRQRILEEREVLLRAISHDLKTPLTRMRLRAELIDDPAVRLGLERDLAFLDDVVASSLRMLEGSEESEPVQRVALDSLVEAVAADLSSEARPVAIAGGLARPLRCRPTAIRRCLSNLVENALKYAGAAHIRVEAAAREIWVHVEDHGPGIPEEELDLVVQPHYRGQWARHSSSEGSGLGLAICRRIAREHGGDLELENRRSSGLRASIRLPIG